MTTFHLYKIGEQGIFTLRQYHAARVAYYHAEDSASESLAWMDRDLGGLDSSKDEFFDAVKTHLYEGQLLDPRTLKSLCEHFDRPTTFLAKQFPRYDWSPHHEQLAAIYPVQFA